MAAENIEVPDEFVCSISHEIMKRPVLAKDGETYEEEQIKAHFAKKEAEAQNPSVNLKNKVPPKAIQITSPLHGTPMSSTELTPNLGIFRQIKRFLEGNPQFSEQVYFEVGLLTQALAAIQSRDVAALNRLIENEKRLLSRVIKDGKNLLEVVCQEGTAELLVMVLSQLRKYYPEFQIEDHKKAQLLVDCFRVMQTTGLLALVPAFGWSEQQKEAFLIKQIREENIPVLEVFIKSGLVSLEKGLDEKQNTALHIAVLNNKPEVVKALINLGANSKKKNKDKIRPKRLAKNNQFFELAENIVVWRREKKKAPLREEMRQLLEENERLRSAAVKTDKEIAPLLVAYREQRAVAEAKQKAATAAEEAKQRAIEEAARIEFFKPNNCVNRRAQNVSGQVKTEEVTELLSYTVRGQLEEIRRCLERKKELAHAQGDVTDLSGRKFPKITGFQLAVWYGDEEAWELYLRYLPEAEAYDQLMALNNIAPLSFFDEFLAGYGRFETSHTEDRYAEVVKAQHSMPAWFVYMFCEEGQDKAWPRGEMAKGFTRNIAHLSWYSSEYYTVRGCRLVERYTFARLDDMLGTSNRNPQTAASRPWEDFSMHSKIDGQFYCQLKLVCTQRLKALTERLSKAAKSAESITPSVGLRK